MPEVIPLDELPTTERQEKAVELLEKDIQEGTGRSKGDILREAGYSPAMSRAPQRVMKTVGFQQELERVIPQSKVNEKLAKYLDMEEVVTYYDKQAKELQVMKTGQPHKQALEAIKEINKIKDVYPAQKRAVEIQGEIKHLNINIPEELLHDTTNKITP